MKKYSTCLLLFFYIAVNGQLKVPSLSSFSKLTQTIGLTEVTVEYSRPSVRDREVFGEKGLLPNNTLWRTGANTATKISFTKSVYVKGNKLERGDYTILTVLNEKEWSIHWFKYVNSNWNFYVDKSPLFTVEIPVIKNNELLETLEIHFQDVTIDSANLIIEWEYSKIKLPIKIDESKTILNNIEKELSGPSSFDYFNAALYLHETKKDLLKALEYIQKVTKSEQALFFQVTREALILRDLKRFNEAKIVAKRGLKLSEKANNRDFIRLNKKLLREL